MRARLAIWGILLLLGGAMARNGAEALNHYGLVALTDSAVGSRLASRFKAKGQPVFLVHDVNTGLSRNDIMRFADRVVLVDDDVWSTLRVEGALGKIRSSPIVRVQGRASAASWTQRAELVTDARQRTGFRLGAEILHVLEENFGGAPHENQLTLVFDEGAPHPAGLGGAHGPADPVSGAPRRSRRPPPNRLHAAGHEPVHPAALRAPDLGGGSR